MPDLVERNIYEEKEEEKNIYEENNKLMNLSTLLKQNNISTEENERQHPNYVSIDFLTSKKHSI